MVWRLSVLVCLACVLTPMTPVTAMASDAQVTPLPDTGFQSWAGSLSKTALSDNSMLSEYVAQTLSEDGQAASLQIAFSPRFGCSPMVRVILSEQSTPSVEAEAIRLLVDEVPFEFPALIDSRPAEREFSYAQTAAKQQELRLLLDLSSHIAVYENSQSVVNPPETDATIADSISFSLLGSQLSTAAVEAYCRSHVAIAFDLQLPD